MSYHQNSNPFGPGSGPTGSPFQQNQPNWDYRDTHAPALAPGKAANAFLTRVFTIMALGLSITGLVSWLFATKYLGDFEAAAAFYSSGISWVVMFAPLVFLLVLSFGIHKLSYGAATAIFIAFASVMGISLSSIFFVYEMGTLFQVFLMTAGTFGAMALIGATTSIDLTKFGSILIMASLGLFIMMIVNWLLQSPLLYYIISGAGVVIFAGLTAYDTQRLLRIGYQAQLGTEQGNKWALMGALALYMDFLNMFLFLLRIFGGGNRD